MNKLTRREFLKLGGMAAAAWMAGRRPVAAARLPKDERVPLPASQGRITTWWSQTVREAPSSTAKTVATKHRDDVIPLYAAVSGEAPWPTNPIWYETEEGYIHSGYVQPVETRRQREAITEVSEPGFWSQVCVPFAEARWRPDADAYVARKLYYGTVYRVVAAVPDEKAEGQWWYQLQEGFSHAPGPYVPSWSVRHLAPEMIAPIGVRVKHKAWSMHRLLPEMMLMSRMRADDKWIKIDIEHQTLICYQDTLPVFRTRIASGLYSTATPRGEFRVLYKRKTRRMVGDDYDLPGVAFPVYFAGNGVALHGTYWHNDYGRRHSHGCVNVSNDAAKWIFRWVDPVTSYDVYTEEAEEYEDGTRVVVV